MKQQYMVCLCVGLVKQQFMVCLCVGLLTCVARDYSFIPFMKFGWVAVGGNPFPGILFYYPCTNTEGLLVPLVFILNTGIRVTKVINSICINYSCFLIKQTWQIACV